MVAFVMVLSKKLDAVTFWDVKEHKEFYLPGRIKKDERETLRIFLSG